METYRVVSITDRKGNPRIKGRYPLRVGRMCKKPTPRNGDAMMIEWLAQPDGTPYVGMIVTSRLLADNKNVGWRYSYQSSIQVRKRVY